MHIGWPLMAIFEQLTGRQSLPHSLNSGLYGECTSSGLGKACKYAVGLRKLVSTILSYPLQQQQCR